MKGDLLCPDCLTILVYRNGFEVCLSCGYCIKELTNPLNMRSNDENKYFARSQRNRNFAYQNEIRRRGPYLKGMELNAYINTLPKPDLILDVDWSGICGIMLACSYPNILVTPTHFAYIWCYIGHFYFQAKRHYEEIPFEDVHICHLLRKYFQMTRTTFNTPFRKFDKTQIKPLIDQYLAQHFGVFE